MPVRASFIEDDGVFWPVDFHTWNLVSAYYNFEQAYEFFGALFTAAGQAKAQLANARIFYFPEMIITADHPTEPVKDNALFFSPIRGIAVLPFDVLQQIPLSINPGVMTHEYSHRVFNIRVYRGESVPNVIASWSAGNGGLGLNLIRSLDEGMADFFAYGQTCQSAAGCNAQFMASSLPAQESEARDLTVPRCLTQSLYDALITALGSQFSDFGLQYVVGTVFANALYEASAGDPFALQQLQQALIEAYSDETPGREGFRQMAETFINTPAEFTIPRVANVLLGHIPAGALRTAACNEFQDRLQLTKGELSACPAESIDCGTIVCSCPRISR
jgi:hypothetical protein